MNRRTVLRGALTTAVTGAFCQPQHALANAARPVISLGGELAGSASAIRLQAELGGRMTVLECGVQHALRESGLTLRNAHAIAIRAPCLAVLAGLPLSGGAAPTRRARLERLASSDVQRVLRATAEDADQMVWPVGELRTARLDKMATPAANGCDGNLKGMAVASLGLGAEIYTAMGAIVVTDPANWTRRQSAMAFDQSTLGACPLTASAALPSSWTVFSQSPLAVLTMPFATWQRMPTTLQAAIGLIARERLFIEAQDKIRLRDTAPATVNGGDGDRNAQKTLMHVARAIAADWLSASQNARKFATMLSNACDMRHIATSFDQH